MVSMPLPMPPSPPPYGASRLSGASLLRLFRALPVVAAVAAAPSTAAAQDLPQGYASDDATDETGASQSFATQPVQDAGENAAGDEYTDTDPSALTDFRQPLAPYGSWVEDPTYGTVWMPSTVVVGADFAPYQSGGHWAMTDGGDWLWVSDYSWGYIPFHYGRWVWIAGRGWAWIPGRTYAPAWVTWRVGDYGYLGWAPMPPSYYWVGGAAVTLWMVPPAPFVFCPTGYVFYDHVSTYVVRDRETVRSIAAHSHNYVPARPSGVPGGASGRTVGYRPASPTLAEAGVPASAAPRARIAPDPRTLAFAHPSSSARTVGTPGNFQGALRSTSPNRFTAPPLRSPQARGTVTIPSGQGPFDSAFHRPLYTGPARPPQTAPAPMPHQFAPAPMPRTFNPSPAPRGFATSPHVFTPAPAPRTFSRPSFSAPSAPHFHVPSAPMRSAPSFHFRGR